jgi:hypothetical protein
LFYSVFWFLFLVSTQAKRCLFEPKTSLTLPYFASRRKTPQGFFPRVGSRDHIFLLCDAQKRCVFTLKHSLTYFTAKVYVQQAVAIDKPTQAW